MLFQLPRDVEDVRDEHDAGSDGGVPSPVFRVREPPAVGGPDLRVEPTTAHVAKRVVSCLLPLKALFLCVSQTHHACKGDVLKRKEFCRGREFSFFTFRVYYLGFVFRSFLFLFLLSNIKKIKRDRICLY